MLVAEQVTNQKLISHDPAAAGRFVTNVELFDVYQRQNIEAGRQISRLYR